MDIFFKKGLRLGKYYRGKINQSGIIQAVKQRFPQIALPESRSLWLHVK